MSDSLRIALVSEGVTDYEVIRSAVRAMLAGRSFDIKLLQPEESVAFAGGGDAGQFGGGWKGVYKWCKQAVERSGGRVGSDPLFLGYDILVIHLDADVAREDPARDRIAPIPELDGVLPCEKPCPPASATTNELRSIMLAWVGESEVPERTVLCTPSKSTEAWVMANFFPHDLEMSRQGWECYARPENRLGQQPIRQRFTKTQANYAARHESLVDGWPNVVAKLTEAARFQEEFLSVVSDL